MKDLKKFQFNNISKYLFIASLMLYVGCLTQNGYFISNNTVDYPGWTSLVFGWVAIGKGGTAWFANPLLLASWILMFHREYKNAALISIFSLLFAASFLLEKEIIADEGGGYSAITGYGLGYWLWLSSIAALLVASIIPIYQQRASKQ